MNDQQPDDRRDELFRFDVEFAERWIMDHGSVSPQFIIHAETGATVIGGVGPKEQMLRYVALLGIAEDATSITSMTEVWVTAVEPGTMNRIPDSRREAVVVSQFYREAGEVRQRHSLREIVRDGDGGRILSLTADRADSTMMWSTWQILMPEPPAPRLRRAAQDMLREAREAGMFTETPVYPQGSAH